MEKLEAQKLIEVPTFRVLVCGGRDITSQDYVDTWLNLLFCPQYPGDKKGAAGTWQPRPDLFLILGGAKGIDTLAQNWADANWVDYKVYPADWESHGKAAGPIRNKQMLQEGDPQLVVCFRGGAGTRHMKSIAEKAGRAVITIP